MRTAIIIFFGSLLSTTAVNAQTGLITCRSQPNADRSISIIASSQASADYTLLLLFKSFEGYSARPSLNNNIAITTVSPGNSEILRLTPEQYARNFSYSYSYRYFAGRALSKMPDTSFQYLFPVSAGASLRVTNVSSELHKIVQKIPTEIRTTGFAFKFGDTICAARAGTVYIASDTVKVGEKKSELLKQGRNRVNIVQRNGSIGAYEISAPIQLLVEPGDEVIPGQPLAVLNKESEKYTVFFSVFYLDEKKLTSNNSIENNSATVLTYLPVYFYMGEPDHPGMPERGNEYKAQRNSTIIAAEMTKKEKKKLGF